MTEYPMNTPLDQIPEEVVREMPKEELLRRDLTVAGSITKFMLNIALDGTVSSLSGLDRARLIASQIPEGDEAEPVIRHMLVSVTAEGLLADALALVSIGHEIERFAQENPDFPEDAPEDAGSETADAADELVRAYLGGFEDDPVNVGASDVASDSDAA
jgi:hypothetical protein